MPPINIWPSAPMLNSPAWKPTATASPARMSGVAAKSVSEISINAYLDILAESDTVQPLHSRVAKYHNRDEYAHAALLVVLTALGVLTLRRQLQT